jgi:hypothetical protein
MDEYDVERRFAVFQVVTVKNDMLKGFTAAKLGVANLPADRQIFSTRTGRPPSTYMKVA